MHQEPSLPTTKTVTLVNTIAPKDPTQPVKFKPPRFSLNYLGHFLLGVWAVTAALITASDLYSASYLERQAQTLMFRTRRVARDVPSEIVILSVNDQAQNVSAEPKALAQLSLPIRRAVYAKVIDQVMQAGAKAVALDFLLIEPSSFGASDPDAVDCVQVGDELSVSEDDRQFVSVLQRYPRRIVMAAEFLLPGGTIEAAAPREGTQSKLILPYCPFRIATLGFIMYPLEPIQLSRDEVQSGDKQNAGRVHRLGSESNREFKAETAPEAVAQTETLVSFAEATLQAAGSRYPSPKGDHIFFYGSSGTFNDIPFWKVLSPENLAVLRKNGAFKDKIVLIGSTKPGEDFLRTPFGDMPGVEIHANAIATLLQGKSMRTAFPDSRMAGIAVLLIVVGAGVLQSLALKPSHRLAWAGTISTAWGGLGYGFFTQGLLIVPMAIPMGAIVLTGFSYLIVGIAEDRRNAQRLRHDLKRNNPNQLRDIIRQKDLRDTLLQERELELLNKKLQDRYKIISTLGSGGFGEAFIAEDTQRPRDPKCVVKQLCPISNNPNRLNLAIKLFEREASTLEKLGKHDQIPQLLAYFEENDEFYLVQEFISGELLSSEVTLGRHLPEARVIEILKQLLQILEFVHSQGVVHRDIKPSNVIKRSGDGKLVLIDFGAVKELHTLLAEGDSPTNLTVGIGTQGYMAPEQSAGHPKFNSDIYALGVIGIQALTGLPPRELKSDPQTSELLWQSKVQVSSGLAAVLLKMVRYDPQERYQSAQQVLTDLEQLTDFFNFPMPLEESDFARIAKEDIMTTTKPWPEMFGDESESPNVKPKEGKAEE